MHDDIGSGFDLAYCGIYDTFVGSSLGIGNIDNFQIAFFLASFVLVVITYTIL